MNQRRGLEYIRVLDDSVASFRVRIWFVQYMYRSEERIRPRYMLTIQLKYQCLEDFHATPYSPTFLLF